MAHLLGVGAQHIDAVVLGSRYEIVRPLRVGNGVNTYLAMDTETGGSVVVKAIDQAVVHAGVRIRFEHETQVLRRLAGLGLGRLVDAGRAGDRLFLVQEFVPGQTLAALLESGPLSAAVTIRIGRDVAAALDIAHGASICHRDVKPANIIIGGTDPIDAVTLIDFGFARSPKLDESIRNELVGTVRYLAPEAAGLLAGPADERSDLYALGVVMFECLAGRPVFAGESVSDLLRHHLSTPAPELRSLGIAVPRSVDDVIQRLLRKDPAERYQSAAALAADLDDLHAALEAGQPEPRLVIGRRDRRSTLTDPSFIGRHQEVAELADLIDALRHGTGGVVTLQADSGGGKSRLLTEVSRLAGELGVTVLNGQGVAQAAQRPFTLLHGVADDLVALCETDPATRDELRSTLHDVSVAIVRALPALGAVLATSAEADSGPEQFGEIRSLLGLRTLLATVATPLRPVLIVLDDCQWADTLTLRLLAELFPAGAQDSYLAVIAAFRTEEVPGNHPLRHLPGSHDIHLGPLPPEALAMLAESMAGPLPQAVLDTVVRLADGNPFMGAAVMRGLVESSALVSTADGWTVDIAKLHDVQAARQSALFLVSRLELLSAGALELLSAGAVLGKQFDVATAVAIAMAEPDEAATVIADASRRRLLWIDEQGGQCRFFHDKIREALLNRLGERTSRDLHSRAADVLIAARADLPSAPADAVFDIAYHLDAAGRGREALPHAVLAAELARSRYALDAAASYYRMAAAVCEPNDHAMRADLAEGLGDVLTLQGIYGEAEASLREARELVQDRTRGAELDGKLGALAFKQGDIPTAKEHLEGAIARLGRRIPRRPSTQVLWLVWELLVQAAHTLAPRLLVGRRTGDGHEDDRLAMRLHSRLAYLYWFHSGKVLCGWTHLRGLNLAERYQPSAELGQAYSEHAPVMTMLPWYRRGIRYAQRSHAIRLADGDTWGQGQSLGFAGVVQYAASQFAPAKQACIEAIELLGRTGDQWEVNTATWNLALCQLRMGDLDDAAHVASELFTSASRIGDQTAAGIALSVWARTVLGRVDGDLITRQLAKVGEDTQTKAELLLAQALFQRNNKDLEAAAASVAAGVRLVSEAGLRQEYVAPLFAWQATILREIAEQTPIYSSGLRRVRLRDSRRAARRARHWALAYRNNAPHALREAALVAALAGRRRRATSLLTRSIAIADQQGARFEAAQSELALAEVGSRDATDGPLVADKRQAVAAFLAGPTYTEQPEPEPTISLLDRFASLLKVGRAITAAPSYRPLEEAIREATLSLLRPESCHLVTVGGLLHDPLTTDSGSELHAASRTLIAEAVRVGSAVVAIDDADPNESLLLSGVRSALAAPIFVQGEAVSCIYATHRQVGELFGDVEIQLADFIATIAGAAFEHLLGNETRFRSLAQNSSDVITLLNQHGVVSYQSPAVSRVFGLPADGILGEPIAGWLHPDDLAQFDAAMAAAAPGDDVRVEHRVRHADGSYRDAETIVTNLLDDPTIGALVLNTRDVTDRKQVEEELRLRNVELERASRAKDMFLATMSHELRTPLNAIIGFTGVLLMGLPGPLNDDQAGQLRTVEQSGRHLLTIINDILDVARIESGTVQVHLEQVDCRAVVESVTSTLSPLAAEKGLDLEVSVPNAPVLVSADARGLGQILMNLVGNAVKFTDTGQVSVAVAPPAHGRVAITVSDTGAGIPAADLDAIFGAFDRGTGETQNRKEGTGLGLYVSYKLAELMNAELSVRSTLGAGTTFTLMLDAEF